MSNTEYFYFPCFSEYLGVHILSADHETTIPPAAGEERRRELQEHLEGESPLPMSIVSAYHQPFSPEVLHKEEKWLCSGRTWSSFS